MKNNNEKMLLKRNIVLNYIIGSLMWGRFFIPVLALFYIASQVTLNQFAIIMAVFSLSTLLFEIPTGALADLLGKKNTLLISRALYIIEIFLIAFFNGFWIFLIAKIISGLGVSLSSGTNSAFLYDTLKGLKKEKEYKKISGIGLSISNVSMAFVFIVGAFLFTINPKLPAIASLPLVSLGFILTFFLIEPYRPKKKMDLSNYITHLKQGLSFFKNNDYLKYLAILTLLAGSAISIMLSMSSAYLAEISTPIKIIGVISFIGAMLAAYSAKKAHKVEERLGEKKSIIFIKLAIVFSVFLMSLSIHYLGILFFLIIPFVQGFYEIILGDYINKHIESSHRATMLSINNMFDNIGIFFLFPIIGFLTQVYSISFSYLTFSIFLAICFFFSYLYYLSVKRNQN